MQKFGVFLTALIFISFHSVAHAGQCAAVAIEFGEKSELVQAFLELASKKETKDLSEDSAALLDGLEKAIERSGCMMLVYESPKRTSMGLHSMYLSKNNTAEEKIRGSTSFYWPLHPEKPLPEACFKKGLKSARTRMLDCYGLNKSEPSEDDAFSTTFTVFTGSGNTMREAIQDNSAVWVLAYENSVINEAVKNAKLEDDLTKVLDTLKFFGMSPSYYRGVVLTAHGYSADLSVPSLWTKSGDVSEENKKVLAAANILSKNGLVFVDSQLGGPKLVKKEELKLPEWVASVGHDAVEELFETMKKAGFNL